MATLTIHLALHRPFPGLHQYIQETPCHPRLKGSTSMVIKGCVRGGGVRGVVCVCLTLDNYLSLGSTLCVCVTHLRHAL